MIVFGINPVLEALRAGHVVKLLVSDRDDARLREVLAAAGAGRVAVEQVPRDVLTHASRRGVHQGVVAEVQAPRAYDVSALLAAGAGVPLIVVLDGVEDPHNVGAILRTCDAAGVTGVVRQTRRAAALGGAAAKASAGAVAHVRIADAVNIARALADLKTAGVWTVGLASDAARLYDEVDYTVPTAFVVGSEGTGLRRLVREHCDWLVSVPMAGHVDSLNVSVTAGIVLYEAVRQRRRGAPGR
jgi:23S rRNA (guanosine2251-2'-O)-methyltransferase